MSIKKVAASLLCIVFIAGCTGCGNNPGNGKKAVSAIEETVEKCEEALRDIDFESFLELTDWDKDSKEAIQTGLLFTIHPQHEDLTDFIKEVTSTIIVDYDQDDIVIKDGKASLKVIYEITDAEEAYDRYLKYGDERQAVKETEDTVEIKGKISFVYDDGEWKITRITGLESVFFFNRMYIDHTPDPTETGPVETGPSVTDTEPSDTSSSGTVPSGTDLSDSLQKAAAAYITVLERNIVSIEKVADDYGIDPVGLYDIDGNGLPELYYFTDAGNGYSTVLHICEYREYMGEVYEAITVNDVLTQGQANNYIIYASDRELVVSYAYGESYFYHVETMIFDLKDSDVSSKWDQVSRYAREIHSDYDVSTDKETVTYTYFLHDYEISEAAYNSGMEDIVSRTNIVLGRRYSFSSDDPEYGLLTKPVNSQMSFVTAVEYLNTLL